MATTPEQHFAQSFQQDASNVFLQQDMRLWRAVTTTQLTVESDFRNYIGLLDDDDEENAVHLGDTVWSEVPHLRRRLTLVDKDKALPIDPADVQRMNYDPTNPYVTALRSYFARWLERKVLRRMNGVAYTGKSGATSVNVYDTGESRVMQGDGTLATAGSAGSDTTSTVLTLKKLGTLSAVLVDANVPEDGNWFIAVDKWQVNQMMVDTTIDGVEWKALRDIRNGQMTPVLGFNFIVLNSDQFETSTVETDCFETFAWHRSAVMLATGSGTYAPEVQIGPRPDKKYAKQIFMRQYADASRMLGPGVIKVLLKKVTNIS